jgi:hypothetical protein
MTVQRSNKPGRRGDSLVLDGYQAANCPLKKSALSGASGELIPVTEDVAFFCAH